MNGKDKCKLLNEVRHKIAEKNNIEFDFEECTVEEDCSGTCPKCESELEYLERELNKKQENGEKIELEGIFTVKETEATELEANSLFETFGQDYEFMDWLVLKVFYDVEMEDLKSDVIHEDEIEDDYSDFDSDVEEQITVFEIQEDKDES